MNQLPCRETAAYRACIAGAAALVAGLSITGCGGSSDEAIVASRAQFEVESPPISVQLEGCIVEGVFTPRAGVSVRARSTDGRLLGHATSNEGGVFTLTVPAQQTLSIAIDQPGGDAQVVSTGRTNLSLGGCLRDRAA